ncbi:MAG: CPBP family intramembrane metalloprotease [Nocardiaceae bacterium]|nr:CPBP family intramembrane metalloprotease [Nocardiaceae bacterium]
MPAIAPWVRRHRIVSFFALTYALSWCLLPFGTFLPTGALIAALVVISIADGQAGLKQLWARIIKWDVGWVWWFAAISIPLALLTVTIALNIWIGAEPSWGQFHPWYSVLVVVAGRMVDPLNGPLAEEPSYRGFAQPTLQSGMPMLKATAVLGLLVVIWHLPLYFIPEFGLRPIESLATFGCTFVYAWLFNHSGGSVLITLVAHNLEGSVRMAPMWSGADFDSVVIIYALAWFFAGVLVVVLDWRFWTQPSETSQSSRLTPSQ